MRDTSGLTRVLDHAVTSGQVPGVIAAAATDDGVIYEGAFGKRDLAGDADMTMDTVCWIASMTKALTGAAAMQLVEQGRLSLDGPISEVLPALASVPVFEGFDAHGAPRLRPARRAITLRHLLTHTSGYVYDRWNAGMAAYMEKTGLPPLAPGRKIGLTVPLAFDPGERWEYGIGIDWAGQAVEAVTGQRLGDYLKAHLFEPLGMADTGFRIGAPQRARLARVHARSEQGLVPIDFEIEQNPEFEMGGGGLYSTVVDYLKFARMMLHQGTFNGARVLAPETVALMSRNAIGDIHVAPMKTASPRFSNDVDFIDGMKWGLSFLINPTAMATGRSAGSLAWAGLANSYYWIDPTRRVVGVYVTQILPFYDAPSVSTFENFEREVYKLISGSRYTGLAGAR